MTISLSALLHRLAGHEDFHMMASSSDSIDAVKARAAAGAGKSAIGLGLFKALDDSTTLAAAGLSNNRTLELRETRPGASACLL